MRRITSFILAGLQAVTIHAAPLFRTGTGDVEQQSGLDGYINLGLQGVARIPAAQLDAFGETFGSVSGLQISNWRVTPSGYAGTFLTLPDRGYNAGAVYSDYRARVQQVDFSFTPYTGTAQASPAQSQFTLNYMGGFLIREAGGTANTTGALPTSSVALQVGSVTSGIVPTTAGGKIAFDAEGMALFKDGSGYITDEYGPNIYYIKDGQIGAVINPPASAMPRATGGTLSFTTNSSGTSAVDPTSGRRSNQGMEAVAITPDGRTLFTMLQSATMQDSVSGAQNRQFTRLYKYDVSQSRSNPVLTAEYVVELPRFNDTKADQTGLLPNRVAAQSEIVALDGERLLLLSRDGNGNGNSGVTPAVFKAVMLMDLSKGSPTNIASLDATAAYSVIAGSVSSPVTSGTATLTDTTAKLNPAITPVSPVQFLNLIGQSQLSKFGLNTNDGSAANPRSAASLSEKWEGMALVSALDPAKPNDYFLFVGNDNDFLTSNLKMKSTTGSISTTAGPFGASVENDTMFLAYRLTLPAGALDKSILTIGSAAVSASMAGLNIVDTGSGLASGTSTYGISGSTLLIPGSLAVSRPIDVGLDGGGLNLLGHSVVLNGSVSGAGALTVFGTSPSARLALAGNNSFGGGLEINAVRVEASKAENLGSGQINLNAGAVLSLLQSGTYSQDVGLYVGGGKIEVAHAREVLWTGSLTGTGTLAKTGAGNLVLNGAGSFPGGVIVEEGQLALAASSVTQGDTLVASPVGVGTLAVKGGATLAFAEQGIHLLNPVRFHPGANVAAPVLLSLGENLVDLAGPVDATAPVEIRGAPGSALTFSGTTSFAGDLSVQGGTVRLTASLAKAPGAITLRSGGGLQALGDLEVSSLIVLQERGLLDGGESVFSLSGEITGAGSLRIAGSPFGTVRLEGLNTYTGGTSVEDTRVEIAAHGADDATGSGGAFGSGDVHIKNAALAFATSSRIPNKLRLHGELTVDVGENTGELGGAILDDVAGPGSLYVTGSPLGALMLSGAGNAYTGPTVVEGTTVRLLHTAATVGTITLRSGGGLQSLGNVQVSSSIFIDDEGRLDGGEGLLSVKGEITGAGRLRIVGSPFGTVRLEGLSTYAGGTSVEDTRVEVAVHGADESSEGAFGSGDVDLKNAILGFATSSRLSNTLRLQGELTIDVGENVGELSGLITDDPSGTGSLYLTGSPRGALMLSGLSKSYTGSTVVEGTTLRLLDTADTSLLGAGTQASGALLPIHLDGATLQIIPDHGPDAVSPASPVTGRDLVLGSRGAFLDASYSSFAWTGVISGGDRFESSSKLTITGNPGSQVELSAVNTYLGGTDVQGGALLKFSSDENLGASGAPVTLTNGGLFYSGTGSVNWSRPLSVLEGGLIDVGSRTVTITGALSGGGALEVGRKEYEGSGFSSTSGVLVVGTSASGFVGRTLVSAGTLLVSATDALRSSTLETVVGGGTVRFATANVNLGGLAGDAPLHFATAGTLGVGFSSKSSRYSGVLSGGSLTLLKAGTGNLSLGAVNTYGGPTNVQDGTLTLEVGADLGPAPISLSSKVTLVINGAGRDLSARFGSVAADALVVFNGSQATDVLKLPAGFAAKTLNLGVGGIQVGTSAATSGASVGKGVSVSLTTLPASSAVTLSEGGALDLSSPDGSQITVNGTSSLLSTGTSDVVTVMEGAAVRLTAGLPASAFKGSFQADGQVVVAPTNSAEVVDLPKLRGAGKLSLQGGSAVIVASPEFNGTTSLASGASAVLTGSLGVGAGAALELAAGSNLKVFTKAMSETVTLPSLSGGGSVELERGNVLISGGNSAFSGSLKVANGVDVTVRGDLPVGTITVVDPKLPLKVESLGGNVSIPGTVTGPGGLALAGGGVFTMTGNAKIETAQLLVGATVSDKSTVLDVSGLPDGVLKLSDTQSLGGGGTVVGSIATGGLFTPGNSPGTFTVSAKTVNGISSGGNLTVGAGGRILIEYGKLAGASGVTVDKVDVASGALTLDASTVKIVFSKFVDSGSWSNFVSPVTLDLDAVFTAASIVNTNGSVLSDADLGGMIELEGRPLLSQVVATTPASSGTLSFRIEKVPYATRVTKAGLQPLANYLFVAGNESPSTGLARYISVLEASVTPAELNALVASLNSSVYAEAQRLSLRRTAAVSETLQGRLVRSLKSPEDGWAAWSESYGWAFHRGATASGDSWNGRNFGEVLGVQHKRAGLTLGLFGAAGTTNASFSGPSSSLSGESFHGGAFVHAEGGSRFIDASIFAGSAEQTAVRNVSFGPISGQGRARFSTGEYAGHLRFGVQVDEVVKGLTLRPSVAVLFNGYSQAAAAESGLDGVGVVTQKKTAVAWQTRLGYEALKKAQLGGKPVDLLASAYWVRDANRSPRSVETRFNGSSAAGYSAAGSALGANGLEVGLGAGVTLTPRTSARLNGVWQVREGSSQPGVNLGVTVQF
jgi:autotransporter-associated beta strand protein